MSEALTEARDVMERLIAVAGASLGGSAPLVIEARKLLSALGTAPAEPRAKIGGGPYPEAWFPWHGGRPNLFAGDDIRVKHANGVYSNQTTVDKVGWDAKEEWAITEIGVRLSNTETLRRVEAVTGYFASPAPATAPEPAAGVTRYAMERLTGSSTLLPVVRDDGEWVKFADVSDTLASQAREIEELRAREAQLQASLMFWMPSVTEATDVGLERSAGDDAYLLAGYDGEFPKTSWGDDILSRAEKAEASLAKAVEVLKPFAEVPLGGGETNHRLMVMTVSDQSPFHLYEEDLRAARAFLKDMTDGAPQGAAPPSVTDRNAAEQ